MKNRTVKIFIQLLKIYPIIYNVLLLVTIFAYLKGINFSNLIADLTGGSIYLMVLCYLSSIIFRLCAWHRILCISAAISIIVEYINQNITLINKELLIIQLIIIVGILLALISFIYEKTINKRNRGIPKEANI